MTALPYRWSGETLEPMRPTLCDKELVVGAVYWMEPEAQRSGKTHNHEFAWLREAWQQLPESLLDRYASPEHLRKDALIEAGFYNETIVDAGTEDAALRFAAYIRQKDEFARVVIRDSIVAERTAKSQSRRAMDPREFQDSKQKVLEIVSAMIGVEPESLMREAGRAA